MICSDQTNEETEGEDDDNGKKERIMEKALVKIFIHCVHSYQEQEKHAEKHKLKEACFEEGMLRSIKFCGEIFHFEPRDLITRLKSSTDSDQIFVMMRIMMKIRELERLELLNEIETVQKENLVSQQNLTFLANPSKILSLLQFRELWKVCGLDNTWNLLYSGSEHNLSASKFHELCDKVEGTLPDAWIFGYERDQKKLIKLDYDGKHQNQKRSIRCLKRCGPIFGGTEKEYHAIGVYERGYTRIVKGVGYCQDRFQNDPFVFNGGVKYYTVVEYEVFGE